MVEPHRAYERRESEEPKWTKSKIDKLEPSFAIPNTDNVDPMRV